MTRPPATSCWPMSLLPPAPRLPPATRRPEAARARIPSSNSPSGIDAMPLSNLFHHHRRPPEQVIREMKEHLRQLELSTGILMADLSKLQAAVAAQVGLISAAQTNLNTVEAALAAAEAGQGGTSQ